jgi:broad specificity phosphatase PhoE
MVVHVVMIRHGETEWSVSGKHTGHSDIPLTLNGEQQARDLLLTLSQIVFGKVLSSPLQRARQTATLSGLGQTAEIETDLTEWDYGIYEGKLTADIRKERPEWNIFRDGCPEGESPIQVSNRADRLLQRLRLLEGNIAIYTHGHFGRAIAARWVGLPISQAQRLLLNTATIGVLGFEHARDDEPVIELWNYRPILKL